MDTLFNGGYCEEEFCINNWLTIGTKGKPTLVNDDFTAYSLNILMVLGDLRYTKLILIKFLARTDLF